MCGLKSYGAAVFKALQKLRWQWWNMRNAIASIFS